MNNYNLKKYEDNDYLFIYETKKEVYKILQKFCAEDEIIKKFLLYEISSNISHFKRYSRANKRIRKEFFESIKSRFTDILKEFSKEILVNSSAYKDFELILNCKNYEEFWIKRFLRKVFEW